MNTQEKTSNTHCHVDKDMKIRKKKILNAGIEKHWLLNTCDTNLYGVCNIL